MVLSIPIFRLSLRTVPTFSWRLRESFPPFGRLYWDLILAERSAFSVFGSESMYMGSFQFLSCKKFSYFFKLNWGLDSDFDALIEFLYKFIYMQAIKFIQISLIHFKIFLLKTHRIKSGFCKIRSSWFLILHLIRASFYLYCLSRLSQSNRTSLSLKCLNGLKFNPLFFLGLLKLFLLLKLIYIFDSTTNPSKLVISNFRLTERFFHGD